MGIKRAILLCVAALVSFISQAKTPVYYTLEWGFSEQLYMIHNYSFKSEYGVIYNNSEYKSVQASNTYVIGRMSLRPSERFEYGIQAGYSGLSTRRAVVPVGFCQKWYFNGADTDGIFLALTEDVGITAKGLSENVYIGRFTTGYRYRMSDLGCIDFLFNLRACLDHPDVVDPIFGEIPAERMVSNSAGYFALSVGIALSF